MKGRALRRALETTDAHRIGGVESVPQITDTTEFITPDSAYQMLLANRDNRPVNWGKVEEYAAVMARGEWRLHAQGIILDAAGNILTGQKRLWAVIYSGTSVYMRVSRGTPADAARVIDRGVPQSSRDLAARSTGRRHSPIEASLARALLALDGTLRPSTDQLAETISRYAAAFTSALNGIQGTRKTRSILMILAAMIAAEPEYQPPLYSVSDLAARLDEALSPQTSTRCWGRGAAFGLAMQHAQRLVRGPKTRAVGILNP